MRLSLQKTTLVLAIAGSLVLLNVLGVRFFKRVDLTRDRMYTLSPATRETLAKLEDPLTVSAYFTENLPAQYAQNARYVRDLLEEYRAASKGKLAFEFIDPAKQESNEDKETRKEVKRDVFGREYREQTGMEKELAAAGLEPVEILVVEQDQRQTKRAYMGLVLKYQDKHESIPVLQSTDALEYELTSLVKKLVRKQAPVVAFAAAAPSAEGGDHLQQLHKLFEQFYDVRSVDLATLTEVPADVQALFVFAPEKPLAEPAQRAIDTFLLQGKSAAFFVDVAQVDVRTFNATPANSGLGPLLATYGVRMGEGLVGDARSASLTLQEQRGPLRMNVQVPYPFVPMLAKLEGDSPLTRGLTRIGFPFVTSLTLEPRDGLQEVVLGQTSPKSWIEPKPWDTNPRREWKEAPHFTGPIPLLVQVSGKLKSHFGDRVGATESRVIVSGGSAIAWDEFFGPASQALMLNIADFLLLDSGMLAMRTRGLSDAPIKADLSDGIRNGVKYGNAIGVPFLLALYGMARWRWRERRRAQAVS